MLYISLILCFLQFVTSQTCTNKQNQNLIDKDWASGELSYGVRILDSFLEFEPVSLLKCAEQCMRRSECKSITFCEKMNFCELNYAEKSNGRRDTRKTKSLHVHSDISSWNKRLQKHLIGNCTDKICGPKHHCNTKGLCELSDCGPPPKLSAQNTVIVGQGNHRIGNGVFVGCKDHYVMKDSSGAFLPGEILPVKCNITGAWEMPSFTCEDMFVIDDHWYYYHHHKVTWETAQEFCHKMNFHLVKIDNQSENERLSREVKSREYVGGKEIVEEDKWIWEADDSRIEFSEWFLKTFDDYLDIQNCLEMSTSGRFVDNGCKETLRFMCEQSTI